MSHSQQIITLKHKALKVMGFNQEYIYLSSNEHLSFDDLKNDPRQVAQGAPDRIIPIANIVSMDYIESLSSLYIRYSVNNENVNYTIEVENKELRNSIASELAGLRGFNKTEEPIPRWKYILMYMGYFAVYGIIFRILYNMARESQLGYALNLEGKRVGLIKLVYNLAGFIGPTIISIVGVLIGLLLLLSFYYAMKDPSVEVTYK